MNNINVHSLNWNKIVKIKKNIHFKIVDFYFRFYFYIFVLGDFILRVNILKLINF